MMRWSIIAALGLLATSCHDHHHGREHGKSFGHEHDKSHDDGHDEHGHDKERRQNNAIGCTEWANGYELFVEISPPKPGQKVDYHAHITRLDSYKPVTKGTLAVEWRQGKRTAAKAHAKAPARLGIFTATFTAPPKGEYEVRFRYSQGQQSASFSCGTISVGTKESPRQTAGKSGSTTLSFTKEQQWLVPFATALSEKRNMARELELPAVVEPAGTDRLTISAPTSGRFFHNPKLSLAEGLHIKKGERVGSIAPTVAGDDFGELTRHVDVATLAKKQALSEIARIKPLVRDGLLPQKRLTEAKNEVDHQTAKLRAARRRLAQVLAPGGRGGLAVNSTLGGVVTEILVANGEPVEPGAPLVRIGGERSRWLRARFVARPDHELDPATVVAIRTPSDQRLDVRGKAKLLSPHPIVDPKTQLATWITQVVLNNDATEVSHALRSGTRVVLLLSVGEAKERIAVPRGAVVDINTRHYVFVQVEGEQFEKRRVSLGVADNDFIEITSGIKAGERVVSTGGYDIHLASAIGSVESHRH